MIDLNTIQRVHFVGIGGIGMSALARMFLSQGKQVSGSDRDSSLITEELKKLGIKISLGQKEDNIKKSVDLVVYTIAVSDKNPELRQAKKMGITTMSYPEVLGIVSGDKFTVAIAGTHGKTTTTAMVAKVMQGAKLDPTVIVGSLLAEGKTNFIAGHSRYLVVEACEYRRSFLNLNPKILAITNIDNDHLDYYKNLRDIQKAFGELVSKVPTDGWLICDRNDPRLRSVIKKAKCRVLDYNADKLRTRSAAGPGLKLQVPGQHNINNAKVALVVADILGVDKKLAVGLLNEFTGTWRRFESKGLTANGARVYDDYGHHPTEIKATLAGARDFSPKGKLIVVFQPHLYSRTEILLEEFAKSFDLADEVIVTDIYAAREKRTSQIHARDLVAKINQRQKKATYIKDFNSISRYLNKAGGPADLIVIMGAGDVFKLGEMC